MPHNKLQNDDLVMSLVERALSLPAPDRQSYLEGACGDDTTLLAAVKDYVESEESMDGFLQAPLFPAFEAEDPFAPGQVLEGRFRIVREVARGGMGIVYEAVDERLNRRIALKCARVGYRKRLPPEVRHASEISHPNVAKIFEIHTASTRQGEIDFLTMEFLEGETLAVRLRRGPLPEREALAVARQLCAGLAEAHRRHVVHGDLKSGNVILTTEEDGSPRAVITDFGLAHGPEDAAGTPVPVGGTPDYMAPELWRGGRPSVASDIYALGVILRELRYGKAASGPGRRGRSRWDGVVERCVEEDPRRRYSSVEEVARALAPPTRRWFAAAAAAVVITVSGAVSYWTAAPPQERVRLALMPFAADREVEVVARLAMRQAHTEIRGLKGGARTRFSVAPLMETTKAADATHLLGGSVQSKGGKVLVRAWLADARTQVKTREWSGEYAAEEVRRLPTALAGMVTAAFHLPPLEEKAAVNAQARQDYLAGLEYLRRNSTVDAGLPLLERAVAADSASPLTHAALAEGYWWKFQLTRDRAWVARSAAALRQAEQRNPDLAEVHNISGLLKAYEGRLEQAEAEYLRSIEIRPRNGDAYRRLGMAYLERNDDPKALAALRRAVELEPDYYRNHQALGDYFKRRAEYREAVRHFAKAVELAPREPATHFALGVAHSWTGNYAEAVKATEAALVLGETPAALNNMGAFLANQGREQEAILYYRRALEWWPERYLLWVNLGTSYRRLHLATDAERAYRRAVELAEKEMGKNPRSGFARAYLAYACAWLGDRRRAGSEIAQALQLAPNDADVRQIAVRTYEASGQREESLAVLAVSPVELRASLGRFPDLADLHRDPRFKKMLAEGQRK